jgi:hypothetical protein
MGGIAKSKRTGLCKCGMSRDRAGQRYCKSCHAKYMRENRPKWKELTEEQKEKANCRSKAKTYQKRGKLAKGPCRVPGCMNPSQNHHPDYKNPLKILRYCRAHHLELHRNSAVLV